MNPAERVPRHNLFSDGEHIGYFKYIHFALATIIDFYTASEEGTPPSFLWIELNSVLLIDIACLSVIYLFKTKTAKSIFPPLVIVVECMMNLWIFWLDMRVNGFRIDSTSGLIFAVILFILECEKLKFVTTWWRKSRKQKLIAMALHLRNATYSARSAWFISGLMTGSSKPSLLSHHIFRGVEVSGFRYLGDVLLKLISITIIQALNVLFPQKAWTYKEDKE